MKMHLLKNEAGYTGGAPPPPWDTLCGADPALSPFTSRDHWEGFDELCPDCDALYSLEALQSDGKLSPDQALARFLEAIQKQTDEGTLPLSDFAKRIRELAMASKRASDQFGQLVGHIRRDEMGLRVKTAPHEIVPLGVSDRTSPTLTAEWVAAQTKTTLTGKKE